MNIKPVSWYLNRVFLFFGSIEEKNCLSLRGPNSNKGKTNYIRWWNRFHQVREFYLSIYLSMISLSSRFLSLTNIQNNANVLFVHEDVCPSYIYIYIYICVCVCVCVCVLTFKRSYVKTKEDFFFKWRLKAWFPINTLDDIL